LSLVDNSSDVILVSDIDDETIKWLKLNDVEIESTVIAKDALVFINNIYNPINSLTTDQIKKIYSGEKTNWKDFNGNDEEIITYSPILQSEEKYMMDKFMGDKPIDKPCYELKNTSLNTLIKAVSEYLDTRTSAMFYTTFYNMKNVDNSEIRIMKLHDIEAIEENIKNDSYSAVMNIYAIIRSDTPENSQTRKFVEYITSKNGQAIIEQCGYVNLIK